MSLMSGVFWPYCALLGFDNRKMAFLEKLWMFGYVKEMFLKMLGSKMTASRGDLVFAICFWMRLKLDGFA